MRQNVGGHLRIHISLRLLRILNKIQKKISLFSLTVAHRHPKRKWRYWLPPWWAFSTLSSSCERWAPVALMEDDHHNDKLFGAACLLRQRGPCSDQYLKKKREFEAWRGLLTKKALILALLLGHIGHNCGWSGDGYRQWPPIHVAENVAEARQGAQQFSQISLACPSSREVVIEIKIAGPTLD
jgi:hypothetical protein